MSKADGIGAGLIMETPAWEKDDPINHPPHYTRAKIEAADFLQTLADDAGSPYCLIQAMKYLIRAPFKNGIQDLEKAMWYIKRQIQTWEGVDDS